MKLFNKLRYSSRFSVLILISALPTLPRSIALRALDTPRTSTTTRDTERGRLGSGSECVEGRVLEVWRSGEGGVWLGEVEDYGWGGFGGRRGRVAPDEDGIVRVYR